MNDKNETAIGPKVSNDAAELIEFEQPYIVEATLAGVADLLFHRWSCEAVEEKSKAAKGSKAKKTDNIESYVYRNDDGELCVPGENVRQAIIMAAKFRQDPRSPRKSAMDLYKAGVVALTDLASFGVKSWDYEHKCRVQIQRNGVTRTRPALKKGWACTVELMVNTPEYIRPDDLCDALTNAGRLCGLCDFRPTYGRFQVRSFKIRKA
jgi:hypothetical protein